MIDIRSVSKDYVSARMPLRILSDIKLKVFTGEFCTLIGASGSGKSTLLNIIGLLDRPTSGEYSFRGTSTLNINDSSAADLRGERIGFIFQSFHLLPSLTAIENVELPLIYRGVRKAGRRMLASAALSQVGLEDRISFRPDQLSGGQRQRVAIARALVGSPSLLLADEPTGNLDSENANAVMDLLLKLNEESGLTTIMVTHDPTLAARSRRRIIMRDGRIYADIGGGLHESHSAFSTSLRSGEEAD